jgi:ribose transport system permease protein
MSGDDAAATPERTPRRTGAALLHWLSFRNASALWVFVVIFAVFSVWIPSLFLTSTTLKTVLDEQSITAMVAVGLVLPLAAGAFDLAIGTEVGLGAIVVAWLLVNKGVPVVPAIAITIVAGALVGVISGVLIVRFHIDSFIATLGMSSLQLAAISWLSGEQQIVGLDNTFQNIGNNEIFGLTLPVYFMLAVALIVYYVLERTPIGRRIYATGGNIEAARLVGVRTSWVIVGSLAACGAIAATGGLLTSANLATGDPTIGPGYLLPAFSAAFLGSTQFRGSRFNVWGTVVAVYVLATGIKGLELAGAPVWIPDAFNGAALLVAVGLAKHQGRSGRPSALGKLLFSRRSSAGPIVPVTGQGEPAQGD